MAAPHPRGPTLCPGRPAILRAPRPGTGVTSRARSRTWPAPRADRAVGRVVIQYPGPSHDRMLSLVDRLSNTSHAGFVNRTQVSCAGGHAAAVRPVRPADLAALSDFFAKLSPQTRYLRFFAPVTPTHALLRLLSGEAANVDAVIAVADGVIVGHAMAADRTQPPD